MKKPLNLIIIIPAHNEEKRIEPTLRTYHNFFTSLSQEKRLTYAILVVLNGCTDNTAAIVRKIADELGTIAMLDFVQAGKGFAITEGFKEALKKQYELIGFVDADMATAPNEFLQLIEKIGDCDGTIASRYMSGAVVIPPRSRLKRWGSKLIFEPLVRVLLGLKYKDLQCGAKVFKQHVIEKIANQLTVRQWAFDVELLYLCKKRGFSVKEIPTVWHDKALSKLTPVRSGLRMLSTVVALRFAHSSHSRKKHSRNC